MEMTQKSVTENIAKAIIAQETYNWKDTDLQKLFHDNFKGYIEDNFRLVSNNNIRRIHKFLRR